MKRIVVSSTWLAGFYRRDDPAATQIDIRRRVGA
jgi:hypothetical protein